MLLNAHTATRSFRELQFDLKAFLEAFAEIMPMDELADEGLVEIKWADGSVDMVPTYKFITGIVHNRFPELLIGEQANLVPGSSRQPMQGGKYYKNMLTLLIKKAGLCARISELGGPSEDLNFVKGVIRSLEANYVELGDGIEVSALKVIGTLTSDACYTDDGTFEYAESQQVKVADSCNLEKITYSGYLATPYTFSHNLSILGLTPYDPDKDRACGYCYVTDTISMGYYDDESVKYLKRYRAKVYYEVPIPNLQNWRRITYDYYRTKGESFPYVRDTRFAEDSETNLMLLYPKKQQIYDATNGRYDECFRLVRPSVYDKDAIISIRNLSNETIHACNAWRFDIDSIIGVVVGSAAIAAASAITQIATGATTNTSSNTRTPTGTITPLSYVDLPPFSAVDFLLQAETVGGRLQVYLLPMRMLPGADGDLDNG